MAGSGQKVNTDAQHADPIKREVAYARIGFMAHVNRLSGVGPQVLLTYGVTQAELNLWLEAHKVLVSPR